MVIWQGEAKTMSVQQAEVLHRPSREMNAAAHFAVGYILRVLALVMATLALLGALAGAGYFYEPSVTMPTEEEPLLIPTPVPGPQPA